MELVKDSPNNSVKTCIKKRNVYSRSKVIQCSRLKSWNSSSLSFSHSSSHFSLLPLFHHVTTFMVFCHVKIMIHQRYELLFLRLILRLRMGFTPLHHRNSDFRIKQSLKFQQTCRGWTTFCSIHHQVLLIHSFKIMFCWHSNVNWQTLSDFDQRDSRVTQSKNWRLLLGVVGCWLLLVVGCWLLVVVVRLFYSFFSPPLILSSLSLFFFSFRIWSHTITFQ